MPVNVVVRNDLSIADLVNIHSSGGRVLKTPHIGNIYPNNLAIASLGIPIILYDKTIGKKDRIFHPNKIIKGEQSFQIASGDILITHALVSDTNGQREISRSLIDLHVSIFRMALPLASCKTYSEYVIANKMNILRLLEAATSLLPKIWHRQVNKHGIVSKGKVANWNNILEIGIFGLTNNEYGWLIPNIINILFHGTIDIIDTDVSDTYLLSGPDMFKYVLSYGKKLTKLYDHLRINQKWDLPEVVNYHIIPVANFRFMVKREHSRALDEVMELYLHIQEIQTILSMTAEKPRPDIDRLMDDYEYYRDKIINYLRENHQKFRSTMFYRVENADFYCQHDLIEDQGIYVHPWAVENNLAKINLAADFLADCFSSATIDFKS